MTIPARIKTLLAKLFRHKGADPETAYDHWAESYDNQPDNLMLALDEDLFSGLLNDTTITNRVVVDIGCGTGRHWKKILDKSPRKLVGFDVSEGMLFKLREKYPLAETHQVEDYELPALENDSCDMIVSTLTIAHIDRVEKVLQEWYRVLRPGGDMIITDYHPSALKMGAKRTFNNRGKTVSIINHVHPIEKIKTIAKQLQLDEMRLIEKPIDETMRPYYEKQQAAHIYEAWKGVPVIYGIHLKKI